MGVGEVVWHEPYTKRLTRARQKKQRPRVYWFTGLPGSGKSTLADALDTRLVEQGYHSYLLDGDNLRHGLCGDLGFSDEDRAENIRRAGEVARLMFDAGLIVITALISPFRADRQFVRSLMPEGDFIEIFVDAPLDVCESRDPKGLYRKARAGDIKKFTGISSPYEKPEKPEIKLQTAHESVEESMRNLLRQLDRLEV